MDNSSQPFDLWCVVELFGHARIAGKCSEQNIAGTNFLRVDVPETKSNPPFTRFFGAASIYSINPVDESAAKIVAERLQVAPIDSWSVDLAFKKHKMLSEGGSLFTNDTDDLPY